MAVTSGYNSGIWGFDGGSRRTEQRRIKRHRDEIEARQNRGLRGPRMSVSAAAAEVRGYYTHETGMWHKQCAVCDKPFDSRRSDAKTCGPTCRKRLSTGATKKLRWTSR